MLKWKEVMVKMSSSKLITNIWLRSIASVCLSLGLAAVLFAPRAHAASLTVSGGCSLNNAITSINAASNTGGCTSTGSYGTNDTITLPSGTTTLAADLPAFTVAAKVVGAGKTSSIINANNHIGFNADFSSSNAGAFSYTFQDFTIQNASTYGMFIFRANAVTATNVQVLNSEMGAILGGVSNVVTNSRIANNTYSGNIDPTNGPLVSSSYNQPGFAGLALLALPNQPSDTPISTATNVVVENNTSKFAGLYINNSYQTGSGDTGTMQASITNSTIRSNNGTLFAGAGVSAGGPFATTELNLTLKAVTVANNSVVPDQANPIGNNAFLLSAKPYIAGVFVYGKLSNTQTMVNITSTGNSVVDTVDDQLVLAGFLAAISAEGASMSIINATIVNNSASQTQTNVLFSNLTTGFSTSFYGVKMGVDNTGFVFTNGVSAQNSIIANNQFNNVVGACASVDKSVIGLAPGLVDLTPTDLGRNITDDPNCTGYNVVPNILSTLGPLQDNGGPVPTIALLPGSPAIGYAQQVLGISTDARGIARPVTPDVGAYQTVLGANTDNPGGQTNLPQLPDTGDNEYLYLLIGVVLIAGAVAAIRLQINKRS